MQLKVLIVDDEPLARAGLKLLLAQHTQTTEVLEARNGREAVMLVRDHKPEMMLLDVQMPGMNGFEVVDAIGAESIPAVIFVTAHDQYALRAFEFSALDYLLKPVTDERFKKAFQRALGRLTRAPAGESAHRILTMLDAIANPRRHLSRFAIRSGDRTTFVPADTVDWIEALQNYVRLHAGEKTYLLHATMTALEASLNPECFLRIHRSRIVNLHRIARLWSLSQGSYLIELLSGERLQTGRKYADRVRSVLSNPF